MQTRIARHSEILVFFILCLTVGNVWLHVSIHTRVKIMLLMLASSCRNLYVSVGATQLLLQHVFLHLQIN